MYCGDETGSFIGEVGSHTCRFGYGGEDNPKLVVPAYVADKERMALSTLSLPAGAGRGGANATGTIMEAILRMPEQYGGGGGSPLSAVPLTDPDAFLRQGDMVEHWDNLQVAWETSMDVLRANDTLKHTRGGTPYAPSSAARRLAKAATTTHAGGASSARLGAASSSDGVGTGAGRCVHPLLAVTPGMAELAGHGRAYCAAVRRDQQVRYTEMLMEALDASAAFLAPAPMLSAFSFGRQTALVVDVGAGGCRVTPVVDGLVLRNSQRRNGRGGDWLGHVTWRALLEESVVPKPRYLLRGRDGPTTPTGVCGLFHIRAMTDLMYEVRTEPFIRLHPRGSSSIRLPFTKAPGGQDVEMAPPSIGTAAPDGFGGTDPNSYRLPDGTCIDLSTPFGRDLCQLPELLFSDGVPFPADAAVVGRPSLPGLVRASLLAVGDVDVRRELAGSVCLTGATALLPHVDARLSQELAHSLPAFVKPRVVSSRASAEKSCSAWIGASILTSLGSFQQLWLSRAEYEEYGTAMAVQRFP